MNGWMSSRPARILARAAVTLVLLAVGGVAGWFAQSLKSTPSDVPTISIYDDWRLVCPALERKDRSCELTQDLMDPNSHVQIAHLTLTERKAGPVLLVTVPYDVLLPSGLGLSLGNDKVRLEHYHTCDTVGCVAAIPVDDAMREDLRQAAQGRLLVAALDKKVFAIPFSMRGFNRAQSAYAVSQAKRRLWGMRIEK